MISFLMNMKLVNMQNTFLYFQIISLIFKGVESLKDHNQCIFMLPIGLLLRAEHEDIFKRRSLQTNALHPSVCNITQLSVTHG